MQNLVAAVSIITFFSGSVFSIAAEKKYGEKQPWSEYHVHDLARPHPKKVKTAGVVKVKAPEDAVVIFDGTSQSVTKSLTNAWTVKDGILIASPGHTLTKQKFGSVQLHLEWRIPSGRKVSGQKGGNSGIFLMNRYEIQIQESYTNETYADGQAAAMYGQTPPMVNATAPQGTWQSYDILFEAPVYDQSGMKVPARVTVIHNGVVVHHSQKYYGPTQHKKAAKYPKIHPHKDPIRFQWHNDPIEFRNIWVRELNRS